MSGLEKKNKTETQYVHELLAEVDKVSDALADGREVSLNDWRRMVFVLDELKGLKSIQDDEKMRDLVDHAMDITKLRVGFMTLEALRKERNV